MTAATSLVRAFNRDQLLVGIYSSPGRRLDRAISSVYQAQLAGEIGDEEAADLHEAANHRRRILRLRQRLCAQTPPLPRPLPERMLANRRKWSASGALPPSLRCHFTSGQNAVAAVVRAEVRRHGACTLSYAQIARAAGVCVTVVKNFMRQARKLGLIWVEIRPVPGGRNLTNIVRIVSHEWRRWNDLAGEAKGGGGTKVPPLQTTKEIHQRRKDEGTQPGSAGCVSGQSFEGGSCPR